MAHGNPLGCPGLAGVALTLRHREGSAGTLAWLSMAYPAPLNGPPALRISTSPTESGHTSVQRTEDTVFEEGARRTPLHPFDCKREGHSRLTLCTPDERAVTGRLSGVLTMPKYTLSSQGRSTQPSIRHAQPLCGLTREVSMTRGIQSARTDHTSHMALSKHHKTPGSSQSHNMRECVRSEWSSSSRGVGV